MRAAQLHLRASHMPPRAGLMRAMSASWRIPSFAPATAPAIVQASCLLASKAIAHLGHGPAGPGCFFVGRGVLQG
jgi:hypothetical protein